MHSLQKLLEYENIRVFPVFPQGGEIEEINALAMSYLDRGEVLRRAIKGIAYKRYEEALALPDLILRSLA